MIKLSFPFTEEKIRALKVGDEVLISRVVFTRREMEVCNQGDFVPERSREHAG